MMGLLMSLGLASLEKPHPPHLVEKECGVVPSHAELFVLAKRYYERNGIWAGVFSLSRPVQQRSVKGEKGSAFYHLKYTYTPVPNNELGREDSGWDQRIFVFRCTEGWFVESMGSHMSAEFP